ncbi:uncharacterized protein LOC128200525 [Galleria mellonella]|uniref:Uncharacterized protein LOC128200525 n=1 Tax=Galleria mellonella TaxID=7137 RepID=A0ABM3MFJ1_GALME|nr:uncharacterized protein LOC128200525 [Galleria mellonella]
MFKVITIMFMMIVYCYCLENNDLVATESRAKKKRNTARLWAMILLFAFSKVAALKVATFFIFMAFFQKVFYIVGLLLNYFLKSKASKPQPVYGAPQDYNTVGYSYGPPEETFPSQEPGLPGISELGGSLNWLLNKNP